MFFLPSSLLLHFSLYLYISFALSLLLFNPLTSTIPSSHSTSLSPLHPLSFLSFCNPSFLPLLSNCPRLSGDLAEAKCFFLFRCRWGCNKACQWEAGVALSHALCFPCVNSLQLLLLPANPQPTTLIHALICPLSLVCHLFPILSCSYLKLRSLTCFLCLFLCLWFPCQRHFREHDEEQQQETPLST